MGRITAGMTRAVSPARRGLVTINITVEPTSMSRLRSDSDRVEPTTVCTSSVSAASRETSSPERVRSKKAWSRVSKCAYRRVRSLAATRSPNKVMQK